MTTPSAPINASDNAVATGSSPPVATADDSGLVYTRAGLKPGTVAVLYANGVEVSRNVVLGSGIVVWSLYDRLPEDAAVTFDAIMPSGVVPAPALPGIGADPALVGAWATDPSLMRYAPPTLVNPIEIGVAAIPGRPGTGVDTEVVRLGFDGRSDPTIYDPNNQDVLLGNSGAHPVSGHVGAKNLVGRNLVVWGLSLVAAPTMGLPKLSTQSAKDTFIEGCIFDHSLAGAGDATFQVMSPLVFNPKYALNSIMLGTKVTTYSKNPEIIRVYELTKQGVLGTTPFYGEDPTTPFPAPDTDGPPAELRFLERFTSRAAYYAKYPRGNVTMQNCRSLRRHGSYFPYVAGLGTNINDWILTSKAVTTIVRDANGTLRITCPGHGLVPADHPLINLCFTPTEIVGSARLKRMDGIWPYTLDPTSPTDTILVETGVQQATSSFNAPPNRPFVLQGFTRKACGTLVVTNAQTNSDGSTGAGLATFTTMVAHGLNPFVVASNSLRFFQGNNVADGARLPVIDVQGRDFTITATGDIQGTTYKANCRGIPNGTYKNAVCTVHGFIFKSGVTTTSVHADLIQSGIETALDTVRLYKVADEAIGYDISIFGQRKNNTVGVSAVEIEDVSAYRHRAIIPYDVGNGAIYLNESDQSVGGPISSSDQTGDIDGPRGLSAVKLGDDFWFQPDVHEVGLTGSFFFPKEGTTIDGQPGGGVPVTGTDGVTKVGFPAAARIAGSGRIGAPPTGDFAAPLDQLGASYVAPYTLRLGADAIAPVTPPAPTLQLVAPSFSENLGIDATIGWVDCDYPYPGQIIDVTIVDPGNALGDRFRLRGARLVRGFWRPAYTTAQPYSNLGVPGRAYRITLRATVRGTDLYTESEVVVPVTPESTTPVRSPVTLNPLDAEPNLVLSLGNSEVAWGMVGNAPATRSVRATRAIPANSKIYGEMQVQQIYIGTGRAAFCFATGSFGVTASGITAGVISIQHNSTVYIDGAVNKPAIPFAADGALLRWCIDTQNWKFWFGNASGWADGNGNRTGGDPTSPSTNGYAIPASLRSTPLFPMMLLRFRPDDVTVAFSAESFRMSPPNGFVAHPG